MRWPGSPSWYIAELGLTPRILDQFSLSPPYIYHFHIEPSCDLPLPGYYSSLKLYSLLASLPPFSTEQPQWCLQNLRQVTPLLSSNPFSWCKNCMSRRPSWTGSQTDRQTDTQAHTYTYSHTVMHWFTYIHKNTYTHMHTQLYTHMHMHTYTHKKQIHIHIHTHSYTCTNTLCPLIYLVSLFRNGAG